MTTTAHIANKLKLAKFWRICTWMLFVFVWLGLGVDVLLSAAFKFAKGFGLGALLAYVMQGAFTFLSHRQRYHNQNTSKAANQMMNDMYVALLAKWVIGILGFALIFMGFKKEVMSLAVFLGFGAMQLGIFVGLYWLGQK